MLSPKVKESLEEAQGSLRNALANAARTEKPIINRQIAEVMSAIDYLIKFEEVSDKIENMMNRMNKKDEFGGFF